MKVPKLAKIVFDDNLENYGNNVVPFQYLWGRKNKAFCILILSPRSEEHNITKTMLSCLVKHCK